MHTTSRSFAFALCLATTACAVEDELSEDLDHLRSGDDPTTPSSPLAVEVMLLEHDVDADEHATLLEGLRDAGIRVLVTLPGGVWLTHPVDPETPSTLEVADHALARLSSLEAVEQRTMEAQEQAQGDAEPFLVARAASLAALPVVLLDDRAQDSLGELPDPIDVEAPHALLPADVLAYAGLDAGEASALPYEQGGPVTADKTAVPARDVGKFLRGRVAVRMFFPESTGVGNEDWTLAEYNDERAAYIAALARLARVAPPTVGLVFDYADFPPTNPVNEIDQEPTNGVNEWEWTSDILDNLGVAGVPGPLLISTFLRVTLYEDTVQAATGADHVAIGFVVKDAEEPRAEFNGLPWRDSWPHAFFDSYLVTTSTYAGGTFMHELLHVFHAADEYAGGNFVTPCRAWSPIGHDRAIQAGGTKSNGNHESCNHHADGQECLMLSSGNSNELAPFLRPLLCWYTRAQVGWHDTAALLVQANYPSGIGTISPTPQVHIAGDHLLAREDFSYVQSGVTQYGSRRCGVGSATGFTYSAAPGLVSACANDRNSSPNLDGGPADVEWASGPTYHSGQSFDEGRVLVGAVNYQRYYCGDGRCDAPETLASCPADCTCGNGICEPTEHSWTCPADCSECGNGICEPPDEDDDNCAIDCCVPTGPGPCIQ